MVSCPRCKTLNRNDANYCYHCGIPLKREVLEMVHKTYDERRRQSVHSALSILIKSGCIKEEKLAELMLKLEQMFGKRIKE